MSSLNKKVSPEILYLVIGVVLVIFGAKMLFLNKPDPLRDTFRFLTEIVPFVLMIFFGLLVSARSVRNLRRGSSLQGSDTLGNTTKIVGVLAGVAFYLFLIPIIFVLIILIMWRFS